MPTCISPLETGAKNLRFSPVLYGVTFRFKTQVRRYFVAIFCLEEKSSVWLPGVSAAPPLGPIPCNLNTCKLCHHANLPVAKLAR